LETLYTRFSGKLVVLAFPSNDFGRQEPGSGQQIEFFVRKKLNVTFPLFNKVQVTGPEAHQIFRFFQRSLQHQQFNTVPTWNWCKLLIHPTSGKPIKLFPPAATPNNIEPYIKALL